MTKILISTFLLIFLIPLLNVSCISEDRLSEDFARKIEDQENLKKAGIVRLPVTNVESVIGSKILAYQLKTEKGRAEYSRNREFFLGESKESYAKYAKQVEECEKYAKIIFSLYNNYKNIDKIIEFESVKQTDNGLTIFHFKNCVYSDIHMAFIYDKDEKCIGYLTYHEMYKF